MSNTTKGRPANSSIHLIITAMIGIVVTGLCCYSFYLFRTGSVRDQTMTDAMKVIRATTEIVSALAERGMPGIRTRLDDVESRTRVFEQNQRQIAERISRIGSSAPVATETTTQVTSEADLLAARRAARQSS